MKESFLALWVSARIETVLIPKMMEELTCVALVDLIILVRTLCILVWRCLSQFLSDVH